MKERGNKQQISASVQNDTLEAIQEIARVEKRSFSEMVDILLDEAVKSRNLIHNDK